MKIVRPATIDAAALIGTSAAESASAWSSGSTYALGAQVLNADATRIFESLQAGNLNHALTDAAWWLDIGPANRWAMFDTVNGTTTSAPADLDVTVKPQGRIDSLGLLNVDAAQVQVIVTDDFDGVIYDQTFTMVEDSGVADWYAYFYEPIVRKTDLIIADLPLYTTPSVRVIFSDDGDPTSIGTMVLGQAKHIGDTQFGAGIGITDYSRKQADDFGNYVLVERPFSRKASFQVAVDKGQTDEVERLLSSLRASPTLYIGSTGYGSTAVFGFYRDFNGVIDYPLTTMFSLELEGLT